MESVPFRYALKGDGTDGHEKARAGRRGLKDETRLGVAQVRLLNWNDVLLSGPLVLLRLIVGLDAVQPFGVQLSVRDIPMRANVSRRPHRLLQGFELSADMDACGYDGRMDVVASYVVESFECLLNFESALVPYVHIAGPSHEPSQFLHDVDQAGFSFCRRGRGVEHSSQIPDAGAPRPCGGTSIIVVRVGVKLGCAGDCVR